MFASCKSELVREFRVGDEVRRTSTLDSIVEKSGRTGPLCFVGLTHEYHCQNELVVRDRQEVVFRNLDATPSSRKPQLSRPDIAIEWEEKFAIDPVVLFRYSAISFNGHRIHYDEAFAVEEEKRDGLLVHSPFLATLLLKFATTRREGQPPRHFDFRSTAAMTNVKEVTLCAGSTDDGLKLFAVDADRNSYMSAMARW
jgi:3-methylfumaryl-CoA hydratase